MTHALFQHSDTPETRQAALFGVMAEIPPGKVVSYGQLAELAGLGRAARWVGRTLSPVSYTHLTLPTTPYV